MFSVWVRGSSAPLRRDSWKLGLGAATLCAFYIGVRAWPRSARGRLIDWSIRRSFSRSYVDARHHTAHGRGGYARDKAISHCASRLRLPAKWSRMGSAAMMRALGAPRESAARCASYRAELGPTCLGRCAALCRPSSRIKIDRVLLRRSQYTPIPPCGTAGSRAA